jgi:hypothetical protein
MALIKVIYNDGNKANLNYKSVEIIFEKCKKTFDTGNFVKDWFDCVNFIVENRVKHFSYSSSVDHFITDGV